MHQLTCIAPGFQWRVQQVALWVENPIFVKGLGLNSMFPPGFEPGTFRVLGERDNHYTTETLSLVYRVSGLLHYLLLMVRNEFKSQPCIGRESNPGLPRGKREFDH